MKDFINNLLTIAILSFVMFFAGVGWEKERISKTAVEVIHDTLTIERPIAKDSIIREYIRVPYETVVVVEKQDTLAVHDTIVVRDTIFLPREQKYYEEADGRARIWVSGYKPSLDRFELQETRIEKPTDKPRFSANLSYGYGIGRDGLSPFFGLTLGYILFSY